jgi:hypothetical protein
MMPIFEFACTKCAHFRPARLCPLHAVPAAFEGYDLAGRVPIFGAMTATLQVAVIFD